MILVWSASCPDTSAWNLKVTFLGKRLPMELKHTAWKALHARERDAGRSQVMHSFVTWVTAAAMTSCTSSMEILSRNLP